MAKTPKQTAADTGAETNTDAAADTGTAAAQLVRMTRDASAYPAPHAADVHPDEVANYAAAGWTAEA